MGAHDGQKVSGDVVSASVTRIREGNRIDKAARLLLASRVHEIREGRVFVVDGDSGRYLVTIVPHDVSLGTGTGPERFTCTCAWGRSGHDDERCSHVYAADAILLTERREQAGDPFARFDRE